jgi:hypothetical protein
MLAADPVAAPQTGESNPQQKMFQFGNVVFSSQFDSGNLMNVVKVDGLTVS